MERTYPKTIQELDSADLQNLHELKDRVSPILSAYPDFDTLWHIFRFFRAKKFNIAEAEQMIKAFVDYRQQTDIDRIMLRDHKDYIEVERAVESGRYGIDRSGRPIVIERLALTDHKELMRSKYEQVRFDYFVQRYERMLFIELPMASAKVGHRVDKIIVINDLEGVSFAKMFDSKLKAFLKLAVTVGQNNYPELTEHTFIVNVPSMFKGMWSMLQSWFNKKNSTSVTLHGSVPLDKLQVYMDVDKLPTFLGGNNTTPLKDNHGPWKDEVDDSRQRGSFFMSDRAVEYQYYYTEDEKEEQVFGPGLIRRLNTRSHNRVEDSGKREVRIFQQKLHLHKK